MSIVDNYLKTNNVTYDRLQHICNLLRETDDEYIWWKGFSWDIEGYFINVINDDVIAVDIVWYDGEDSHDVQLTMSKNMFDSGTDEEIISFCNEKIKEASLKDNHPHLLDVLYDIECNLDFVKYAITHMEEGVDYAMYHNRQNLIDKYLREINE